MILNLLLLAVGLAILIFGAEWLVAGASGIAKKLNVSDLAIGLTVVSFGTSAPELVVNTFAAWEGKSDIVFGNIIGSNNFNLLAILGVAGLISPLIVQRSTVWKEIPISLLAAALLFLLANDALLFGQTPSISRLDGIILLVFFAGFLYYVYKHIPASEVQETKTTLRPGYQLWGMVLAGLGGLVLGGRMVVSNAVELAQMMGVSEKIIGLTIVAAGTSLPELATSVVAAIRKNNDIAVGNVVGSNIFNIFLILGLSAVVKPVGFNLAFNTDIYLLLGSTIFLFAAMFLSGKKRLDRWEAFVLLGVYVGYTIWLVSKEL